MAKNLSISPDTVHLLGPGKLKVINGRLAFSTGSGTPTRLDPAALKSVVCYGNVGISDDAFAMLFNHDVDVSWLSRRGDQLKGRLTRSDARATRLRLLQHRVLSTAGQRCAVARLIVDHKIESQLTAARHYSRHGNPNARAFVSQAQRYLADVQNAASVATLRGIEGGSSRGWFQLLAELLKPPWEFPSRVRRPPTDPVNSLLSLGYTWLSRRMVARIQSYGLEVNLGALHEFRHGRPSLACDLVEPLRAPIVDRWVLTLCNRRMISPGDFDSNPQRGVHLTRAKFSALLLAWEQRWIEQRFERQLDNAIEIFIRSLEDVDAGADPETSPN